MAISDPMERAVQLQAYMQAHLEAADQALKDRNKAILEARRTMGVTAIARQLHVSTSTIKGIK